MRVIGITIHYGSGSEHVVNLEVDRNSDGRFTVHSNRRGHGFESFDATSLEQAVGIALATAGVAATVGDVNVPVDVKPLSPRISQRLIESTRSRLRLLP